MDHRRERALDLLRRQGAAEIEHLGSDLLTHLLGTEAILRAWRADEDVALAGLCHAAYGTDGFAPHLLELGERGRLAAVVGAAAEAAVYRYASCDRGAVHPQLGRPSVDFADRFRGTSECLGAQAMRSFALVTAANETDLVRRSVFDAATEAAIADLIARLAPYLPDLRDLPDLPPLPD
ncbi:MAG TPA: hypothetical protein VGO78_09105 [Acidimicrobiales bacterium]|nr:hypothetical protein [Acidimicrobiales bacterium]